MNRKSFVTRDGVSLCYLEGGKGRPLLMLPGWAQTAAMFSRQFNDLRQNAQVIALDHRGHGESEKPSHGYRVQRLAKDLFELIDQLELFDFDLLAHSMGAAISWSYLSLFGAERPPRRLVFVDEPAALLARPNWSESERKEAGAIVPSLEAVADFVSSVQKSDEPESLAELLRPMFTNAITDSDLHYVASENLKLPRAYAADLVADNIIQDWRLLIKDIRLPTLVFGGAASVHPPECQRWIADTIPNAELDIFPADERGSHFLFFENPDRFNERTVRFLNA